MLERDAAKPLTGRVEIDDAYLGGKRTGGKRGRGADGKTPFVAAVETTDDGKPVRLKLRRVTSFCAQAIATFAKTSLTPDCAVLSDGLRCFGGVTAAGCSHQVIVTGSGPAAARTPAFKWGQHGLLATSRRRSPGPIGPSAASTRRATSPNSSIASIVDTIWPP